MRDRNAERGHDRVAGVLLHGAAVPGDGRRDRLEVVAENTPERLGIERRGERHRLDDVDEEDRDEPPELHCRAGERRLLEEQRLVLAEDRRLELAQLGAGIDAELLDERLARCPVGRERVRLPARAVERKHELRPRPLAERLRLHERLELRHELRVPGEREIGVDPLLEDGRAQLLEPRDLGLRERLVEEVRERRAAPERESFTERALGRDRVVSLERGASLLREACEPVDVDPLRRQLELVAGRAGRNHRPERLAELGDIDLDRVGGGLGRITGPQRLDQPVDGDDAAGLEREHGKERARLRPPERDELSRARGFERPEKAYVELWGACPARSVHVVVPSVRVRSHFLTAPRRFPHPTLSRS